MNYVVANENRMDNSGEKEIRFRHGGQSALNSIVFQATDVRMPLAAVSRTLEKGNKVAFSRHGFPSYRMKRAA